MPTLTNSISLLQANPALLYALTFILGASVGSFLNVVIYRLPVMMQRNWRAQCLQFLKIDSAPEASFNLMGPPSHCPHCKTPIPARHNIPIFGYLKLKGKCASCAARIPARYFWIELSTALLSCFIVSRFGVTLPCLFALILAWSLIALAMIDLDHQLLPDSMTLPLLWLGLILNYHNMFTTLDRAVLGAVAGYLCLWSVFWMFKLTTGKAGMGYGDFKLLAMLGAWLGWRYLPLIVIGSSLVASAIGIALVMQGKRERETAFPFGPYLAAAGMFTLIWGDKMKQSYESWLGLGLGLEAP